ncbi:MAG: NAD-dependent epimerase/dehydratase [Acidimicrobiales bacterium]|nr:NAD-dependent epimerase/dehydratase [Acidimicrobiales bacterium]
MPLSTLITGGAGFIGAHVADRLLRAGDHVRVLDALHPQVHGQARRPAYLSDEVELRVGDVRDREAVAAALVGIDRVLHLTARVGVGQSMYEIAEYASVNAVGTGVLLEALLGHPVDRLVVASSMSVYGEGLYADAGGRPVAQAVRTRGQLERGQWDPLGPAGETLHPAPTPEWKAPMLTSVYALTKFDQERMCLLFGEAYRVPTIALRFFNVYGPHQALSNPYTGVLAIFASRLLNGRPPLVFEDGQQRRDFVSVHDVARACALALVTGGSGHAVNVGSGQSASVSEIAGRLARILGRPHLEPLITRRHRVGDVRHCFADISLARELLGYAPAVDLDTGLTELAGWLEGQAPVDRVDAAAGELAARGLTV